MDEKEISSRIMRYLKTAPGIFAWKEHGGLYGTAGLPDIICCFMGYFVAFEVKQKNGRLSKLQEITIRRINDTGGHAYKVTSVEEVKTILHNLGVSLNVDSMGLS